MMAEQRFNPEHIIELAEELRLAGFDIGTQQHIAAQDLLIALAAHNRLPADPREWRSLLAPIFCASPNEQEEFYGRYEQWLKRHPEWKAIEDDLHEPTRREITIPAAAIHWLRKPLGIASAALLILLIGFAVFLSLKTNHTLTGEVFSSENEVRLSNARAEFWDQQATTNDNGNFTINYRVRNWYRVFNRQMAELKVSHDDHEPSSGIRLDVHQPSHQSVKLQKRPVANDPITIKAFPPQPEDTPPPIPLLPDFTATKPAPTTTPNPIRWYHWLLIASPLALFAIWLLLRWRRRRALLQKLQAAGNPNLRRLTVRGASDHLFQSQTFRRAVQDLRRHRRVEVRDLDIAATVNATIRRGGMFQPRYGVRKASPEYLLLIDRASLADEQARFAEEFSQRLEAGGVFVDRFYFQNDPLTCRQRELNSPTVTLLDLAARYPEHQLLIFSDGAGFISPLTGEAELWLTSFSHWPLRVMLTPELDEPNGYRELELAENDFLVLPVNDAGLAALTEAINAGILPNLKPAQTSNGKATPFPQLILERPKRWLERHEPRPAALNELCDQVRAYLGEDGWYWLAACAVYPALSWDVTLYLGYNLFGRVSSPTVKDGLDREAAALADARATDKAFEDRLLRLIRLPWFRYGSMPDWLRLRLIESFTPEQETTVRQTIETMLLSALDHPQEGIPLEIAEHPPAEPGNWLQRLRAKWHDWRQRKKLADFIEHEPEESPLKDFVFLGFLSGNRARRLTVKLPELLNRALFPQGQAVLGVRPAMVAVLAILLSATGAAYVVNRSQQGTNTPPTLSQFYQQMDKAEQLGFVAEKTRQVFSELADRPDNALREEDFELIRQKVSDYAARVGNGSTYDKFASPEQNALPEDLSYVFGRGVNYAPEIFKAFTAGKYKRGVPGLYLAMMESEFRACPKRGSVPGQGMFLRPDLRLNSQQGCNWQQDARELGDYFASIIGDSSTTDKAIQAIAGANYVTGDDSGSLNMRGGHVWNLLLGLRIPNNPGQEQQDNLERAQLVDYVYCFLAAAIVGENPIKFGLDMEPLSRMAQRGLASPSPSPSVSPTPTPTPMICLASGQLVNQGGYVIRSIGYRNTQGQVVDIGSNYPLREKYLGQLFTVAIEDKELLSDAQQILSAQRITSSPTIVCYFRRDPGSCGNVTWLVQSAPSPRQRPACVDAILAVPAFGAENPNPAATPFTVTQTPTGYSVNLGEGVRPLELVLLQGGQFTMGSDKGSENEKPPHQVQLSAFSIGKYEVTQAQWQAVMGNNPSRFKGDDLPVENVSWNDVQEFIKRLNDKTGSQQFRLPTEAEWEYAARAGTDTEYSFGDDEKLLGEYAWYYDIADGKTHPVGTKKENQFGLFDMHGNVWEWCSDWYDANYYQQFGKGVVRDPQGPGAGSNRVVRGGSWRNIAVRCRSALRSSDTTDDRGGNLGFRLVRIGR